MKLTGAEAARRLAGEADARLCGILLYGPDAGLVTLTRQAVVAAFLGRDGEAEMRLERIAAADLRRDPALVGDAMRARGFFPGPRVVLVEGAGDAVGEPILAALRGRRPEDAWLVVTAGVLAARSGLRKGFEAGSRAAAIALYPDPPRRGEVEARLARAGVAAATHEAIDLLLAYGTEQDAGAFDRLLDALALYRHGESGPATPEDVAAVAPDAGEGDLDFLLQATAEGKPAAIPGQLRRLAARGTAATTLAIAAARHFRALHAAACASDGPEAALGRQRPPVFGPRRSRMAAQARRLGEIGTEKALTLLTDADLALRSSRPIPQLALVERTLIRIACLPVDGVRAL